MCLISTHFNFIKKLLKTISSIWVHLFSFVEEKNIINHFSFSPPFCPWEDIVRIAMSKLRFIAELRVFNGTIQTFSLLLNNYLPCLLIIIKILSPSSQNPKRRLRATKRLCTETRLPHLHMNNCFLIYCTDKYSLILS